MTRELAATRARLSALEAVAERFSHPRATRREGHDGAPEDDVLWVEVTFGDWAKLCTLMGRMDAAMMRALPGYAVPSVGFIAEIEELEKVTPDGD